jgi:hypothetical protein
MNVLAFGEEPALPPDTPRILPPATDDGGPLDPWFLPPALPGRDEGLEQVIPGAANFAQPEAALSRPARAAAEADLVPVAFVGREGDTAGGAFLRGGEDMAPAAVRSREDASALADSRRPVTPSFTAPQRMEEADGNIPSEAPEHWWVDAAHLQAGEQAEVFSERAAGQRVGLAEPVAAALIASGVAALCRRPTPDHDRGESVDYRRDHPTR